MNSLVQFSTLKLDDRAMHVVRDDRLFGGTKERAALPFLRDQMAAGYNQFVYASPFCGFAQVALAAAGKALGCTVLLVAEQDQTAAEPLTLHPFSELAQEQGARVLVVSSLAQAESTAARVTRSKPGRYQVPLGFNCAPFRAHLRTEVARCWDELGRNLPARPKTVWVAVGSGTLANVLRDVLPESVAVRGVDVGVLPPGDERLGTLRARGGVLWGKSAEAFSEPVREPPPIPSNRHYDAKLWSLLRREARAGDLWWNIAR